MGSTRQCKPDRRSRAGAGESDAEGAERALAGSPLGRGVRSAAPFSRLPAGARSGWALGAGLFVLAVLLYLPAMGSGFIWNDDSFVYNNELITRPGGLWKFWFSTEPPDYFPLTSTMLWVEWRLWGDDATGYHVVNVLLHAASCVLLWRVLRAMAVPGAFLGGLLFAVHPVNVESVAWITERKNTLPVALFLGSVLMYLRSEPGEGSGADEEAGASGAGRGAGRGRADRAGRRRGLYAGSLALHAMALLAKTSVVIQPLALLLGAWWMRRRIRSSDLKRTAPFFVLSLAFGLVTIWYQTHSAIGETVVRDDGFASRLAIAGWAVWFYLYKAVLPIDLAFVYPRWEADVGWWPTWIPLALLVVGVGALVRHRRTRWGAPLFVATAFYLMALLPILGFVDIYFMLYSLVADHWQYVALIGFVALAGGAMAELGRWVGRRVGYGAAGLAVPAVVVSLLAAQTWRQQSAYADERALWTDTLAKNPGAWLGHNELGQLAAVEGRYVQAIEHYKAALELNPGWAKAHNNLGAAYLKLGREAEAERHFRRAAALDDRLAGAPYNLGLLLRSRGDSDGAIASFKRAVEHDPRLYVARYELGATLLRQGRFGEAVEHLEAAAARRPESAAAWDKLGSARCSVGRFDEGIEAMGRAVALAPDNQAMLSNLAWVLAICPDPGSRDAARAARLAERAVELTGRREAMPLNALAAAHAELGRFERAVHFQRLALDRASPSRRPGFERRLRLYERGRTAMARPPE